MYTICSYRATNGIIINVWKYLQTLTNKYIDTGGDQDTILVAGSARSGTTWVGDVIADATHSRIIFEPFLVDSDDEFALVKVKQRRFANISYNRSLSIARDSGISNRLHDQIGKIISGNIYSNWTEQQSRKGMFKRRLIKDIRVSLMLGHITLNWPLVPIVYIIREPLDVIKSQIKKSNDGWKFGWDVSELKKLNLHKDIRYSKVYQRLKLSDSAVTSSINRWFVENVAAVHDLKDSDQAVIVSYDKLKHNYSNWNEIATFFENHGILFDQSNINYARISFTSDMNTPKHLQNTDGIENSDILYLKGLIRDSILSDYITI